MKKSLFFVFVFFIERYSPQDHDSVCNLFLVLINFSFNIIEYTCLYTVKFKKNYIHRSRYCFF